VFVEDALSRAIEIGGPEASSTLGHVGGDGGVDGTVGRLTKASDAWQGDANEREQTKPKVVPELIPPRIHPALR